MHERIAQKIDYTHNSEAHYTTTYCIVCKNYIQKAFVEVYVKL